MHLWDPKCSAFRIGDYEITITVEEVAGLLKYLIRERLVIFPSTPKKAYFCTFTGLRKSAVPGPDDAASIDLKFLYDRFAIRSGFSTFRQDLVLPSEQAWKQKRPWVYGLVMAGIYLFPRSDKRISFQIDKMISDFFFGIGGRQGSIVPTIVADLFVSCTLCKQGASFFFGANRILHVWAMEHFKCRQSILNSLPPTGNNWIATYDTRVDRVNLPKDASGYLVFLRDYKIRWVLDWTDCTEPDTGRSTYQ